MPEKLSTLYTSQGQTVTLGKKLGEGGEGYVCEVNELPDMAAKIYHINNLPDEDKQDKLRYMIANSSEELLNYIAWATDTLHKAEGDRIVGFLMPKVSDCQPIHTLYNPSHRRHNLPNLTWRFLLYTARNVASAINTLHQKGHVIGDINQGNLLFSQDSKVILIDADSFQINTPTTTHLSLVGVSHFTPPELQGNTNFDKDPRTQNHDNFGLAVLIFHLLFCGRHPYAGVPLIDEAGNSLESDIKAYRYVYAPDHEERGIEPPFASISIDIVPRKIQALFIQAFTETGSIKGSKQRPTAEMWMDVLDGILDNIVSCEEHEQHDYLNHLPSCPWCELKTKGLVYFGNDHVILPRASNHQNTERFIKQMFDDFNKLPTYDTENILTYPDITKFKVIPKPLPKGIGRPKGKLNNIYEFVNSIPVPIYLFMLPVALFIISLILFNLVGFNVMKFGISMFLVLYTLPLITNFFFAKQQKKTLEEYNNRRYYVTEARKRFEDKQRQTGKKMKGSVAEFESRKNGFLMLKQEYKLIKTNIPIGKDTYQKLDENKSKLLEVAQKFEIEISDLGNMMGNIDREIKKYDDNSKAVQRALAQAYADLLLIEQNLYE